MAWPIKPARPGSFTTFFRHSSSSTNPAPSSTASSVPPKPVIDYNRIIATRNGQAKNLVDRQSHLTPDALEDVAYLYSEFKNLSKKLAEARQRQNSLGAKIKQAISSLSAAPEDNQPQFPSKEDEELLLSPGPLSKNKTHQLLQNSNNAELAAKVNDYHAEAASLKDAISNLSKDGATLENRLLELAAQLPNESHPSVPIGSYEHSEIVSLSSGSRPVPDPLPFKSFQVPCRPPDPKRDHLNVMTELGWLSFPDGQKTTGPSFSFLLRNGAFLELALTQYAIQHAVRAGWSFSLAPEIVRTDLAERCGFSPRDGGESNHTFFVTTNKIAQTQPAVDPPLQDQDSVPSLCLTATAEIPLIGSHHSTTLPSKNYPDFPLKPIQLVSVATAFRAEAGSRGSQSRGLYRVHQFKKVELVAITPPDVQTSEKMLQKMLELQILILSGLNLPYRVLEMSSQELGASAYHKYDIEVWMPGRGRWGEVSSASNCTDYQSRRLGIRSRVHQPEGAGDRAQGAVPGPEDQGPDGKQDGQSSSDKNRRKSTHDKPKFVHTLNATAAAIPRLIVGLIENGVVLDQNHKLVAVQLPECLKNHWLGDSHHIQWIPASPSQNQH